MSEEGSSLSEEIHVGVLTVSDTRAELMEEEGRDEDVSGKLIQKKLKEVGISSVRTIIPDDEERIRGELERMISDDRLDSIITTGGTGLSSRDRTVVVAREFFDREFGGFGELLRRRGYEEVGLLGVFTHATAGLADQKPIFCLPGVPNSVEIGMDVLAEDLPEVIEHARS